MIRSRVHNPDVLGDASIETINGRVPYPGPLFMPAATEWPKLLGWTPTALYRGDEFSGNVKDRANSNDLAAAGTIVYDAVKGGRRGLQITANASGFSAAVLDFANTNTIFGAWFAVTDAVAAQRSVMGRYAGTRYCLISIQASNAGGGLANKILIQSTDGTTAVSFTLDKVMTDGVPRLVLVHRDVTLGKLTAGVYAPYETAVTGTADLGVQGSLTGGATPLFNYGYANGVQNGDDNWMGGGFVSIDAARTGANLKTEIAAALGVA